MSLALWVTFNLRAGVKAEDVLKAFEPMVAVIKASDVMIGVD